MILSTLNGMILRKVAEALVLCGLVLSVSTSAGAITKPQIVAAVSEWGSLAHEVVGNNAVVHSLLTDPNSDPHEHEASLSDATSVQQAQVIIVNGAGYDNWFKKLLANKNKSTVVFNVAEMMKTPTGGNPHLFFDLNAAQKVVNRLEYLPHLKMFHSLGTNFAKYGLRTSLAIHQLQLTLKTISAKCAGVKVAATEDIAGYLLSAAKLKVVTPKSLRLAIGNGVDPSVSDLATALQQLGQHPAFLVYNSQTTTPLTTQLLTQARADHVPVIKIAEVQTSGTYTQFVGGIVNQMKKDLITEGCMA